MNEKEMLEFLNEEAKVIQDKINEVCTGKITTSVAFVLASMLKNTLKRDYFATYSCKELIHDLDILINDLNNAALKHSKLPNNYH